MYLSHVKQNEVKSACFDIVIWDPFDKNKQVNTIYMPAYTLYQKNTFVKCPYLEEIHKGNWAQEFKRIFAFHIKDFCKYFLTIYMQYAF